MLSMTIERFDGATRLRIKQCLNDFLDDPIPNDENNFIDKLEEFILIPKDKRECKCGK